MNGRQMSQRWDTLRHRQRHSDRSGQFRRLLSKDFFVQLLFCVPGCSHHVVAR